MFGRGELIKVNPLLVFDGTYEINSPGMPLSYRRRDIALATELDRELNITSKLTGLVEHDTITSANKGHSDRESMIFLTDEDERANVSVKIERKGAQKVVNYKLGEPC